MFIRCRYCIDICRFLRSSFQYLVSKFALRRREASCFSKCSMWHWTAFASSNSVFCCQLSCCHVTCSSVDNWSNFWICQFKIMGGHWGKLWLYEEIWFLEQYPHSLWQVLTLVIRCPARHNYSSGFFTPPASRAVFTTPCYRTTSWCKWIQSTHS
jgi:hypothetical protein